MSKCYRDCASVNNQSIQGYAQDGKAAVLGHKLKGPIIYEVYANTRHVRDCNATYKCN